MLIHVKDAEGGGFDIIGSSVDGVIGRAHRDTLAEAFELQAQVQESDKFPEEEDGAQH
jgi:hypothetical protein